MKTENWNEVSRILADCLEIEVSERQTYLKGLNISSELRADVENYLAFEENVEELMDISAVEFSRDFFEENNTENAFAGQKFGAYKVIRELGQGGMGAVYLAERTDGKFEQKVALKLLKREMNTVTLRRRFEQERNILASLEHPNIARLLNAGTTDDKIPYIAMEYIEGLPIDEYCNKNNMNLSHRLDLFRKVCAAVAFAHRNLVVHRDLKPSNILITKEGTPKLLDFGISKIISEEIEQLNSATITKLGVMTPGYASPEQLQRKSVTTSTDIYSLGIILYELLSGHRPFESKEDDLQEIYQAVIEINPPLPSSMIKTSFKKFKEKTEAETAIKSQENKKSATEQTLPKNNLDGKTKADKMRQTKPQNVSLNSQSIRGDLDNIILKSIRKEPERRYSSAENFSEDIKRHLRGLPVNARPNTFSYRAEKFFKRNRASVFAGGFIVLAIISGLAATLWQARIARAEKVKAERRFNDVRSLANSFLFNLAPKIESLPGSTPAREELISLALEYLDSLSKEASGDLELQRELAAAYEKVGDLQGNQLTANLGDPKEAAKSYEKALNIRQKLYELNSNNLTAMSDLASSLAKTSEINRQVGTTEQVNEYLQKSLDLREEIFKRNPKDFEARRNLAIALRAKGRIFYTEAKYIEAVEQYDRVKDIYVKLLKEQPNNLEIAEGIAYIYVDYGEAQGWNGDLEAAEISLKKALDLLTPIAENNPNNQNSQRNLMLAYMKKGASTIDTEDYEKAIKEYGKGLEIAENILKVDPQNFRAKWDVIAMQKHLADAVAYSGKPQESIDILTKTLERAEEISKGDMDNPKNLYEIANVRYKIGEAYFELNNFEESLKVFKETNKGFRTVVDKDPTYRFAIRVIYLTEISIADSYFGIAEKRKDKELYRKALESYRISLKGFTQLKDKGIFPEYDNKYFTQIETAIKKAESKLGK